MAYELIERDGVVFAEIIWAGTSVDKTRFFSHEKSSFQFGLLAHKAGFVEEAHYHKSVQRSIGDVQQMFVVQRGVVDVVPEPVDPERLVVAHDRGLVFAHDPALARPRDQLGVDDVADALEDRLVAGVGVDADLRASLSPDHSNSEQDFDLRNC